jgi:hypothetical protein
MIAGLACLVILGWGIRQVYRFQKEQQDREWARKIARRYSGEEVPEPKRGRKETSKRSKRGAPGAYTRVAV